MTAGILREIAAEVAGAEKARRLWARLDVVGDIALIKSPRVAGEQDPLSIEEYREIARRLLERLRYIKSVWLVVGPTEGVERVRDKLVHLAGEERTETVYVEHGCRFKVDIARVFVTPRLSFEHARVASLVKPGERVVNMFAGAGLFSIIIACRASPRVVHSIDVNPHAYRLIVENARLNKVSHIVKAYLGDAGEVIESRLMRSADRVLMPLPALALDYLKYAVKALEGEGVVHVYLHVHAPRGERPEPLAERMVLARLGELGARGEVLGSRVVRKVGPRWSQVVVDVRVRRP